MILINSPRVFHLLSHHLSKAGSSDLKKQPPTIYHHVFPFKHTSLLHLNDYKKLDNFGNNGLLLHHSSLDSLIWGNLPLLRLLQ